MVLVGTQNSDDNDKYHISITKFPKPTSSMLHRATPVKSEIYLVTRSSPILEHAPHSLLCISSLAQITNFSGASSGLFQDHIECLITYSKPSFVSKSAGKPVALRDNLVICFKA